MTTLAEFRRSLSRQGLLLPAAFVNDINRAHETDLLDTMASMAALARSHNPGVELTAVAALYATLNTAYPLEASGLFSFEEILEHFHAVRGQRLEELGPSAFPMPEPFAIDGITVDDLNRAEAERYTLSEDDFSNGPEADQVSLFADVMTAAIERARTLHPERVGAPRPPRASDFPIGNPPTDMEPDLSLILND